MDSSNEIHSRTREILNTKSSSIEMAGPFQEGRWLKETKWKY